VANHSLRSHGRTHVAGDGLDLAGEQLGGRQAGGADGGEADLASFVELVLGGEAAVVGAEDDLGEDRLEVVVVGDECVADLAEQAVLGLPGDQAVAVQRVASVSSG
jgi:hypothetical protein